MSVGAYNPDALPGLVSRPPDGISGVGMSYRMGRHRDGAIRRISPTRLLRGGFPTALTYLSVRCRFPRNGVAADSKIMDGSPIPPIAQPRRVSRQLWPPRRALTAISPPIPTIGDIYSPNIPSARRTITRDAPIIGRPRRPPDLAGAPYSIHILHFAESPISPLGAVGKSLASPERLPPPANQLR